MKFSELITMSRIYVPGAKQNQVNNEQLKIVLNKGAEDIARLAKCMKKDIKFAITAGVYEYNISDIAEDFCKIAKEGIRIYDGTKFKEIYPKTQKWLDNTYPNWRDGSETTPNWYYIEPENDKIGFYQIPGTSYEEGAQMFYYRKPEEMVDDDDVPFHVDGDNQTEIPSLTVFDDCIFDYVKWKLAEPLSKPTGEVMSRKQDYINSVLEKMASIKEREDVNSSETTRRRQGCGRRR